MERLINKLAERHDEWVYMARSFGCNLDEANELVQEMYIRITKYVDNLDKIMYNETEINTYYIYLTIRNLYLSQFHKYNKKNTIQVADIQKYDSEADIVNFDLEQNFDRLVGKIGDLVEKWYWYDRKMWDLYFSKDMSMRTIEKKTKISLKSIFNTLTNGKEKVKYYTKDEYQAYIDSKES